MAHEEENGIDPVTRSIVSFGPDRDVMTAADGAPRPSLL
jgi:hypothetical protein